MNHDPFHSAAYPFAAPHRPGECAIQLRALGAAAERLSEGDLAQPDAEVQAALAALGARAGLARIYTYARRAYHLAKVMKLERDLLVAAMHNVEEGRDDHGTE